ncbi:DUF5994 family protein [Streptomyces sp. NPDC050516]|uniref:DUF5994 family protein n=1 Tax=Streptomyces sp. NPDC050516 TaxID=3365621 RepID=UPI0037924EEA
MSASTDLLLAQRDPPTASNGRLALKPAGASRGLLDGAWWPRSRDLLRELPALIDVLDPLWGRITRIAVNPEHWPVVPCKIPVTGHVVKAGWFKAEQDPHKLLVLSYGTGRWDLLVIPPQTSPAAAARLMAAASDPAGLALTASALIAGDEALHGASAGDRLRDFEEAWEHEGGTPSAYAAVPARPDHLLVGM